MQASKVKSASLIDVLNKFSNKFSLTVIKSTVGTKRVKQCMYYNETYKSVNKLSGAWHDSKRVLSIAVNGKNHNDDRKLFHFEIFWWNNDILKRKGTTTNNFLSKI